MPENLSIKPSETPSQDEIKLALGALASAMRDGLSLNDSSVSGAMKLLEKAGISGDVVWVMLANKSANVHLLGIMTGLNYKEIKETLDRLKSIGWVESAISPMASSKIAVSGTMNDSANEEKESRATRMKNEGRVAKLMEMGSDEPEKILTLFPLFESLKKRREGARGSVQSQRKILDGFGALEMNISAEMDEAENELEDAEKKAKLSGLKKKVLSIVSGQQKEIISAIENKWRSEEDSREKEWLEFFRSVDPEVLEDVSYELHAQLAHLKNLAEREGNSITPYREFRIRKIAELESKLRAIDNLLSDQNYYIMNTRSSIMDQSTESAPTANPEPKGEEAEMGTETEAKENKGDEESGSDTESATPKDPEDLTEIFKKFKRKKETPKTADKPKGGQTKRPKESAKPGTMNIEDIEKEASEEKPKARVVDLRAKKRVDLATITRRNLLKVILAGTIAAGGFMVADHMESSGEYTSGIERISAELPSWSADQYLPSVQQLSQEADKKLEELKSKKKVVEDDKYTRNWIEIPLSKEALNEPLVRKRINGQEIILKKSAMERFEAAWKILDKHGIGFQGGSSFRSNQKQFELTQTIDEQHFVGSMANSFHLLGQAVDVGQMGMDELSPDGRKIIAVMEKLGWKWGIEGNKLGVGKKATSVWGDLKRFVTGGDYSMESLEKLRREMGTEDRVHFSFFKSAAGQKIDMEKIEKELEDVFKD